MKDTADKVKTIRRDFQYGELSENDAPSDPLVLLKQWLDDSIDANLKDPNAFVLSTVLNGQPDSRVVLLRDMDQNGLQFFTNYSSKKGLDMGENSSVSLNFFWADLDRQIRIHADITKLNEKLSDDYFASRPRESQIGAWASSQSSKLESRALLNQRIAELEKQFKGKSIPRPDFWGGYLCIPKYYEFWQGRESRLHDRITYNSHSEGWKLKRLYP